MSDQPPPPGPPPPPPPPQPQQPAQPAQPAMGLLQLTLQGSMLTTSMISPRVRINGGPVATSYGLNSIPVYAGPTHVEVDMQWLRAYGQAATDVTVAPGQTVPLFYAAPWHQFSRGAIGPVKQKKPGGALGLVILAIVLVIVVLIVLATL